MESLYLLAAGHRAKAEGHEEGCKAGWQEEHKRAQVILAEHGQRDPDTGVITITPEVEDRLLNGGRDGGAGRRDAPGGNGNCAGKTSQLDGERDTLDSRTCGRYALAGIASDAADDHNGNSYGRYGKPNPDNDPDCGRDWVKGIQ